MHMPLNIIVLAAFRWLWDHGAMPWWNMSSMYAHERCTHILVRAVPVAAVPAQCNTPSVRFSHSSIQSHVGLGASLRSVWSGGFLLSLSKSSRKCGAAPTPEVILQQRSNWLEKEGISCWSIFVWLVFNVLVLDFSLVSDYCLKLTVFKWFR